MVTKTGPRRSKTLDGKLYLYTHTDFQYIRSSELTSPEEKQALEKWMEYQTRPLIEGIALDEQDAIYSWDYERWCEVKAGRKVPWD